MNFSPPIHACGKGTPIQSPRSDQELTRGGGVQAGIGTLPPRETSGKLAIKVPPAPPQKARLNTWPTPSQSEVTYCPSSGQSESRGTPAAERQPSSALSLQALRSSNPKEPGSLWGPGPKAGAPPAQGSWTAPLLQPGRARGPEGRPGTQSGHCPVGQPLAPVRLGAGKSLAASLHF